MLYIVHDTRIKISDAVIPTSQGGTSTYLAGFINHLLRNQIEFGLIGNFEINDNLGKNVHISHPSTNLAFLKYLIKLILVKKFDQKDIFYFQRPVLTSGQADNGQADRRTSGQADKRTGGRRTRFQNLNYLC